MKLEDQVCSLELAKRLKELGVKQESAFMWQDDGTLDYRYGAPTFKDECSAFTVAELGEMLPPFVTTEKYLCREKPRFNAQEYETIEQHTWHDDKEADARAKMLIYLLESKLITPQKETPR